MSVKPEDKNQSSTTPEQKRSRLTAGLLIAAFAVVTILMVVYEMLRH